MSARVGLPNGESSSDSDSARISLTQWRPPARKSIVGTVEGGFRLVRASSPSKDHLGSVDIGASPGSGLGRAEASSAPLNRPVDRFTRAQLWDGGSAHSADGYELPEATLARVGPASMRSPLSRPGRGGRGTSQASIRRHPLSRGARRGYPVAPTHTGGGAVRHAGPRGATRPRPRSRRGAARVPPFAGCLARRHRAEGQAARAGLSCQTAPRLSMAHMTRAR
jgi:hypothetical protein